MPIRPVPGLPAPRAPRRPALPAALVLLAGVALALLAGIAGGLLRAGAGLPDWNLLGHAAVAHGALMAGSFMGTVIGVERAVALRGRWPWAAPTLSAASGPVLLAGAAGPALALLLAASAAFVVVNTVLVRRQPARHTALLLGSALAWLGGNLLALAQAAPDAVLAWWFAFLVLTVAAERLEMTRLMRRRPAAMPLLAAVLAALLAGAVAAVALPAAGGLVYGAALLGLAAWLLAFDIARVTVRAQGLPRYMAVCLLGGHAWLGLAGLAWAATALGAPLRDAALHAIALGFLGSMVMGHAPVILPAVARIKLQFSPLFYLPLALLHLSLALRVAAPWAGEALAASWRTAGAVGNAAALALFAAVAVTAARAWRRRHAQPPSPDRSTPDRAAAAAAGTPLP